MDGVSEFWSKRGKRNSVLTFRAGLTLLAGIFGAASSAEPSSTPEAGFWLNTVGGCKILGEAPQNNRAMVWTGPCVDGLASGHGVVGVAQANSHEVDRSAPHFEGMFADGIRSGYGSLGLDDGSTVFGHWQHDGIDGAVVVERLSDGFRYEGEYHHLAIVGFGIGNWRDGTRYVGEWRNGLPSGTGAMTYKDGTAYRGEFRDGVRVGHGVIIFPNGTTLEGQWADNVANGPAWIRNHAGEEFWGSVVNSKKSGQGTYVWPDGSVYRGYWRDNLPNGEGEYRRSDGHRFSGNWKLGCLLESGEHAALFVNQSQCK